MYALHEVHRFFREGSVSSVTPQEGQVQVETGMRVNLAPPLFNSGFDGALARRSFFHG